MEFSLVSVQNVFYISSIIDVDLFSSNVRKSCNTLYNHLEQTGTHGLVELFRTIKY